MYWIPKLHKNLVGSPFIIPSKSCSKKPVSIAIKLIFSQIENFHRKSKFLSNYSKFWVLQIIDPVIENINIIIERRKLNLLQHMTLVHYTPYLLMIN